METETVDRIEHMARSFAVVLVALRGLQSLCDDVQAQMGPFAVFVALMCIGLCWHAHILRGLFARRPKLFMVIVVVCVMAMTAAFGISASIPSPSTPALIG
jgi:uncharacterized membrane protein AbrB (regulator of aidB expression)